mgnify:CR=1 FL=1
MFFTTSHVFFRITRKKRNKTMKYSFCNHKARNICRMSKCFRHCPDLTSLHHGFSSVCLLIHSVIRLTA